MRKLILASLVAAVVVAGCSSDDKKSTSITATPGTNGSGTTAGNVDSGAGDDDFAKLVEETSKARIRVTYQASSSNSDAEELGTISQDGTGKRAYFDPDGDSQTIVDGDTTIVCNDLKTTPECNKFTGTAGQAYAAAWSFLTIPATAIAANTSGLGDESSETIAGRDGRCVSLDYIGAELKACADKETGVLLKWEAGAAGKSGTFVATEVGEPKDSDFEPAAEPTEVTVPDISIPDISLPEGVTLPGG